MLPALSSPTTVASTAHTSPAESQSCCADLLARVQAVWEAFCAWISDLIAWCATQIHGVGTPADLPEPSLPHVFPERILPEEENREAKLLALLGKYDQFSAENVFRNWNGTTCTSGLYIGNSLPFAQKVEKIKLNIQVDHLLFLVANPYYTREGGTADEPERNNRTKLLLELGGNPNQTATKYHLTPLYCAIRTGCFLAYRTLREFGADPVLQPSDEEVVAVDYIQLIQNTLETLKHHSVIDCFNVDMPESHRGSVNELEELFPKEIGERRQEHFGTQHQIQHMLDFEKRRVEQAAAKIVQLWKITPPLANLIADYGQYYI